MTYIGNFIDRCLDKYLDTRFVEQCAVTQMVKSGIDNDKINIELEAFLYECNRDTKLFG